MVVYFFTLVTWDHKACRNNECTKRIFKIVLWICFQGTQGILVNALSVKFQFFKIMLDENI